MNSKSLEELEKIFSELPEVACKGACSQSCNFIATFPVERKLIKDKTGKKFILEPNGRCSFLQGNRCSIYRYRPTICRIFGSVKKMRCPFGCKPSRWLNPEEEIALLEKLKKLSDGTGADLIGVKFPEKIFSAGTQELASYLELDEI